MYVFVYRNITSGGCESLITKLAKQFQKDGYRIMCICETISECERHAFFGNRISVKEIRMWVGLSQYIKELECGEKLDVLTFEWETFCTVFFCKRKNKKTVLYTIHPKTLIGFGNGDDSRGVYKSEAKRFVEILAKRRHIVVMDEAVCGNAIDFYEAAFDMKVIPISVDVEERTEQELQPPVTLLENPRMLTAARAEFPFKGYLLGLIKWFGGYEDTELMLEVVSYGEGIDFVRKEIDELPHYKKDKIVLHERMQYDELRQLIMRATIYVGMGTSILDAAKQGVLSIPVQPGSYDVLCNGFFHDHSDYVCADKSLGYVEFTTLVDMALQMEKESYQKVQKQNIEIVKSLYNTQVVAKSIEALFLCLEYDNAMEDTPNVRVWRQIEESAEKIIKKRLMSVKAFAGNRKIIIWGAGKGGRDLLNLMKEADIEVFGFVDINTEKKKQCIGFSVENIDILDCYTDFVVISLKKFEPEIIEILRSKGFVHQNDFIYPYCEAKAKEESNVRRNQ